MSKVPSEKGYVIEQDSEGTTLVVTGDWSRSTEEALASGAVGGLELNYARGYRAASLDFLRPWPLRRLLILDRSVCDVGPVHRLGETLEELSVETDPRVRSDSRSRLNLRAFVRLRKLGVDWEQARRSIGDAGGLREFYVERYGEPDLQPLGGLSRLTRLIMKQHPEVDSLRGLRGLGALKELGVFLGRKLADISDLGGAGVPQLRELELEGCTRVDRLDALSDQAALEFLNVGECGDIESLVPLVALRRLRGLYLYGSTRVVDGDLHPLLDLEHLVDLRIKDRRHYRPPVREVKARLGLE